MSKDPIVVAIRKIGFEVGAEIERQAKAGFPYRPKGGIPMGELTAYIIEYTTNDDLCGRAVVIDRDADEARSTVISALEYRDETIAAIDHIATLPVAEGKYHLSKLQPLTGRGGDVVARSVVRSLNVDPAPLNAWKCWNCGGVLAKLHLLPGCAVEIKCPKCRVMNTAAIEPKPSLVTVKPD